MSISPYLPFIYELICITYLAVGAELTVLCPEAGSLQMLLDDCEIIVIIIRLIRIIKMIIVCMNSL